MAKYDYQLKKSVVESYQRGEGGFKQLADHFGIPDKSTVRKWVKTVEKLGFKGLHRRKKKANLLFPI